MMNGKQLFMAAVLSVVLASPGLSLELSEVMYNPNGTDTGREWIEIYTPDDVNLSGVRLLDNEGTHGLTLVAGDHVLPAGDRAVIASNAANFFGDYPAFSGTLFQASFSLSNTGEEVGLYNTTSAGVIDTYNYTNELANGNGRSLEKVDGIWQESTELGGTPGYGTDTQQVPEFSTGVFVVTFLMGILAFFVMRKR